MAKKNKNRIKIIYSFCCALPFVLMALYFYSEYVRLFDLINSKQPVDYELVSVGRERSGSKGGTKPVMNLRFENKDYQIDISSTTYKEIKHGVANAVLVYYDALNDEIVSGSDVRFCRRVWKVILVFSVISGGLFYYCD